MMWDEVVRSAHDLKNRDFKTNDIAAMLRVPYADIERALKTPKPTGDIMAAVDKKVESESEKITLHALAVDAYAEKKGDIKAAKAMLMARLIKDRDLLSIVIDAALSMAVGSSLQRVASGHRATIIKTSEAPTQEARNRASVIALSRGLQAAYMDWPLPNGLKLRDARRSDLVISIDSYTAQAATISTRATWLNLVMQSLPDDNSTVGQRLNEARLVELYKEVSAS